MKSLENYLDMNGGPRRGKKTGKEDLEFIRDAPDRSGNIRFTCCLAVVAQSIEQLPHEPEFKA
jgi:hypothetical protein